jgi:hypothetical protein
LIPIEPVPPVEGNKEVCDLLEGLLKRARLGEVNCIAAVFCESPTVAFMDHAGVNTSHFAAYVALDQLKRKMVADSIPTAPHVRAPVQSHIPGNLVCYDVNNEPVQFDFLPWAINAEMTRIREGALGPLKIAFVEGPTNIEFEQKEIISRNFWMDKVIVPICRMIGAEITDEALGGRRPSCYSFIEIVEAAKAGETVPRLQVTPGAAEQVDKMLAMDSRRPITITLRESQHWQYRNSNPDAWLPFARDLQREGEFVIFIRDTYCAADKIDGFAICPVASRDLDVRVALYERAKCNLFVDNGPWTLALMGSAPWLAFINADPMTGYIPNTPQWWKRNHGVAVGEQFPWSDANQRIIWKPDSYENLCQAWNEFKPRLLARAA